MEGKMTYSLKKYWQYYGNTFIIFITPLILIPIPVAIPGQVEVLCSLMDYYCFKYFEAWVFKRNRCHSRSSTCGTSVQP